MREISQLSTIISQTNGIQSFRDILKIKGLIPQSILTSEMFVDRRKLKTIKPTEPIVQ